MKKRIMVLFALALTLIMSVSAMAGYYAVYVYHGSDSLTEGTYMYTYDSDNFTLAELNSDSDLTVEEQIKENSSINLDRDGKEISGWKLWTMEYGNLFDSSTEVGADSFPEEELENTCHNSFDTPVIEAIYSDISNSGNDGEGYRPDSGRSYSLKRKVNTRVDYSIIYTDGVVQDAPKDTAIDYVNEVNWPTITVISSSDYIILPAGMVKEIADETDVTLILSNKWGGFAIPYHMLKEIGDKELKVTILKDEVIIEADGEPFAFEEGIKMVIPYTRKSSSGNVAVSVTEGETTSIQQDGYDKMTDTITFVIKGSCAFGRIDNYDPEGVSGIATVYVSSPNKA